MNRSLFGFALCLTLLLAFAGHVSAQTSENIYPKMGPDFKVGPFTTIQLKSGAGGREEQCSKFYSFIGVALQDMQKHMAPRAMSIGYGASWDAFQVNQETLDLFCNKHVIIALQNKRSDVLLLNKLPFSRWTDPKTGDVGTMIRISAAIILDGDKVPGQPNDYGQVFIPDRLLK